MTASLVLFFLPDPAAALRAWHELLTPGGRLAFTTFGTRDGTWSRIDALVDDYLPPALLDARTAGQTGPFSSPATTTALAATWTTGLRQFWLWVPEDVRPTVRNAAFETLQPLQAADGSVVLDTTVRVTTGRRA